MLLHLQAQFDGSYIHMYLHALDIGEQRYIHV